MFGVLIYILIALCFGKIHTNLPEINQSDNSIPNDNTKICSNGSNITFYKNKYNDFILAKTNKENQIGKTQRILEDSCEANSCTMCTIKSECKWSIANNACEKASKRENWVNKIWECIDNSLDDPLIHPAACPEIPTIIEDEYEEKFELPTSLSGMPQGTLCAYEILNIDNLEVEIEVKKNRVI